MKFLSEAPDDLVHQCRNYDSVLWRTALCWSSRPSLNQKDFEFNYTCSMSVTFDVSKQKGEIQKNKFNSPLDYCEYLKRYAKLLDLANLREGKVFKTHEKRQIMKISIRKCQYVKMSIMKKRKTCIISKSTVKVATFWCYLILPVAQVTQWEKLLQTSCCALSVDLKKHFNRRRENASMKYIDNTNSEKQQISKIMRKDKWNLRKMKILQTQLPLKTVKSLLSICTSVYNLLFHE